MKRMKWILVLAGITTATSAFAWQERGNGGDAVKIGSRYYSLDLYENGVERQPSYRNLPVNANIERELRAALRDTRFPIHELAVKLTQMYEQDPMFPWWVIRGMELYTWVFVNGPLVNIEDEQDTVVDRSRGALVQAAIRSKAHVRISYPVWKKLDRANQAALVLHEMVYALTHPLVKKTFENGEARFVGYQDSSVARRVIGFWFSEDFGSADRGWKNFVFLAPDISKLIPHSHSTTRMFRFSSKYAERSREIERHRLVHAQFFVGKNIGLDYVVDDNGRLIRGPEELCAEGADGSFMRFVRPSITESFRVIRESKRSPSPDGLPEKAALPLAWLNWDTDDQSYTWNPRFRDSEDCVTYLRRFTPTVPFRD